MNQELGRSALIASLAVLFTAVTPIFALHSFNMQYVQYPAILRSLWISCLAAIVLVFALRLVLRSFQKAAAVTILFLLLFFLYGHVFELLAIHFPVRNIVFTGVWILALIAGIVALLRKQVIAERFIQIMLIVSGLLALFNFSSIVLFEFARHRANQSSLLQTVNLNGESARRPDIYYIVLDAHARPDLLQRFGYDGAPFVERLQELGFFLGSCSQANYWLTAFSVGSTLRMEYFGPEYDNEAALPDWKVSAAIQNLRQLGYQIVAFETRANDINNQVLGEDIFLSSSRQETLYQDFYFLASLNDFEASLIRTSWLHSWLQLIGNYRHLLPNEVVVDAEQAAFLKHYRQTYYILEQLPELSYIDSPKFVYVHFLVPHEPYIFDASGHYVYRHNHDEFVEGYRNNIEFIDGQIVNVIDKLLSNSAEPPIIILQGDHGPNGSQADLLMPILNAYYFPDGGEAQLYESISPVNTFRILFSYYFGADYELLPDLSYYGRNPNLSEGTLVENFCDS